MLKGIPSVFNNWELLALEMTSPLVVIRSGGRFSLRPHKSLTSQLVTCGDML